VVLILFRI